MTRLLAKAALPFAWAWAKKHEREILRAGVTLRPDQKVDARKMGVVDCERVRVLVVESVPPRMPFLLRKMAERFGLGPSRTAGMALGYGIFIRADFRNERALLLHEFVHTAQYERLGFRPFLEQYLHECFNAGYPLGALEEEARQRAHEFSD